MKIFCPAITPVSGSTLFIIAAGETTTTSSSCIISSSFSSMRVIDPLTAFIGKETLKVVLVLLVTETASGTPLKRTSLTAPKDSPTTVISFPSI